jgi:hypothetical protein
MSNRFIEYLKREHARLERELESASSQRFPDQVQLARLKKLKLAVRDQIATNEQLLQIEHAP